MRIVHVIDHLRSRGGGPAAVAANLARAQAEAGHTVALCTEHPRADEPEFSTGRHTDVRRFRNDGLLPALRGRHDAQGVVAQALDDLRADVLHLHGLWEPALLAAASAARQRRIPIAANTHGMLDEYAMRVKPVKKAIAYQLIYRKHAMSTSLLLANSQREADAMIARGLGARVAVIPNGVELEALDVERQRGAFRRAHPELGEDPYVLFLSRLDPIKGLDIIVRAFAILHQRGVNARLVVAGSDWGAEAPLREAARSLGVEDRVHLVGPLYGDEKKAAFADCYCFALASIVETFGIVIAESLAAGRPVVITNTCHLDTIEPNRVGVVTERTPEAFADGLASVFADPAEADRMGERGKELVRTRYTWPAVVQACDAEYRAHGITERNSCSRS